MYLNKLRTLLNLLREYRNPYLFISLSQYLDIRKKLTSNEKFSDELLKKLILPNGHICIILNKENFVRAAIIVYDEIYIQRIYERVPEFKVTQEDIVLDAGAFIGLYTLKNAHAREVYAIEPHPLSYILLRANVAINDLSNVRTLNYALTDYVGEAELFIEDLLVSGSTLLPSWHGEWHKTKIKVKTITLNTLYHLGFLPPYVDIAKVDIEGSEMNMIRGGQKYLRRGGIDRLVLEVHHVVVNLRELLRTLNELNFKILKIIRGVETSIVYARLKK